MFANVHTQFFTTDICFCETKPVFFSDPGSAFYRNKVNLRTLYSQNYSTVLQLNRYSLCLKSYSKNKFTVL